MCCSRFEDVKREKMLYERQIGSVSGAISSGAGLAVVVGKVWVGVHGTLG